MYVSVINPSNAREHYESTRAQYSLAAAMELDDRMARRHSEGQGFTIQRGEVRNEVPSDPADGTTTGVHWTVNPHIAARFAQRGEMSQGRVHTIWHGVLDDREHQQEPNSVFGQPQEREITLRDKSAVRVTGVSYYAPKPGESGYVPTDPDKWTHVDFRTHRYLGAQDHEGWQTSLSDHPDYQSSRTKIGATRDHWTELLDGDTEEGIRHSRVLSPSQFSALKDLNPDYSYPSNPRQTRRYQDRVFDAKSVFSSDDPEDEGMPYHHPDGRILRPEGGDGPSHAAQWMQDRL